MIESGERCVVESCWCVIELGERCVIESGDRCD